MNAQERSAATHAGTSPHLASETAVLKDGTALTIRPARPDDGPRIARAFAGLERDSVYTRFFSFRGAPSDAELARLLSADFVRRALFVATVAAAGDEIVVATGRYDCPDASGDTAEVAFAVEEDYQGKGIAGRLLARVAQAARANGIARLEAMVLGSNASMLRVFERTGWPMTRRREDDAIILTMTL
jgi:GNAT superfamily N-acetyltransferase